MIRAHTRLVGFVLLVVLAVSACGGEDSSAPLDVGKSVYADTCSVCHGARGEGGVGKALDQVAVTFPTCAEQIKWIELGSDGWKEQIGPTYGTQDKEIEGAMPGQFGLLLPDQIAAVAAFERASYGGVVEAEALADCGLSAEPG